MKTPEKDCMGNIIDHTVPVSDKPCTHISQSTGEEEHWCGKCAKGGHWGNHLSKDHDKWLKDFHKKQAKWKNQSSNCSAASVASNESSPFGKLKGDDEAPVGLIAVATSLICTMLHCACIAFDDSDDESI